MARDRGTARTCAIGVEGTVGTAGAWAVGGSLPSANAGGGVDNSGMEAGVEGKAGGLSLMGELILSSAGRVKLSVRGGRDATTTLQQWPRAVAARYVWVTTATARHPSVLFKTDWAAHCVGCDHSFKHSFYDPCHEPPAF